MFKKTIRGEIMKVINARINDAQRLYEADEKSLNDQFDAQVEVLKTNLTNDKASAFETRLESVLSKVI